MQKKSHESEKTCTKIFGHVRDPNPSFCLADLKNHPNLEAEEATLVWQLVEAIL